MDVWHEALTKLMIELSIVVSLGNQPTKTRKPYPYLQANLHVRHISPAQLHERHVAGLCYYYDEKYHTSHKCSPPKFCFYQKIHLMIILKTSIRKHP